MKTPDPLSKEKIIFLYKKALGREIDGDFYKWLCEDFCEENPWECDGCPFLEK